MTTVRLTIRFDPTRRGEPQAWLVPGAGAEDWLAEIVTWNVPQSLVSLRVIPRSRSDRSPAGVLATVAGNPPVNASPRCQGYGRLGERLFLPLEAQLEPAVSARELVGLLAPDVEYVWHPAFGLAAFEPHDVLSVGDLLPPAVTTCADWDRAQPGEAFTRRLVSIEVDRAPSADVIIQEGRDDIASQSDALDELPPGPNEPGRLAEGLGSALGAPLRAAARFVNWLTSHAPARANRGTWVDRVQQWTSRMLTSKLRSARERELDRLIAMLDEDPDRGLKYAPPMGGDPGRGIAPPSARLSPHEVDFRLGSSGGPADCWDVDAERHHRLAAQYRALAEREVRLGRFRRAAYIYAKLLGEFGSAAAALKSGGYYREAAVLYEERLQRPREAAECLEEGGLWNEAIARYEALGDFEKTGQLYRKLGQHEEADAAYRKAVEAHRQQNNLLAAAKLLESELGDVETALSVLRSGWPSFKQAQECLHGEFRLLARLGRHGEAARRVAELRDQTRTPVEIVMATTVLVETTKESPDTVVRAEAADATRVIVARRLVETSRSGREPERPLLAAIENLEPQDRLLRRDCQRFLQDTKRSLPAAPPPAPASRASVIERIYSARLPTDVEWQTAAASDQSCFAAGYEEDWLVVARIGWGARAPDAVVHWDSRGFTGQPILLAPSPNDNRPCWVQTVNGPPLPMRRFSTASAALAVSPPWSRAGTVGLAQSVQGVSWMLTYTDGYFVSAFSADGTPILSRPIPMSSTAGIAPHTVVEDGGPIPFHARSEGAYFASGDWLISIDSSERVHVSRHDQRIVGLSGSASLSRVRVAVSYVTGGAVVWRDNTAWRPFGGDLYKPLTAFTVSGFLIAVDSSTIEAYRTDRHRLTFAGRIPSPGTPIAVMPVGRNDVGILDDRNHLTVYRLK